MKLVDRRRDLEPGLQDGLHPLKSDVLGPLDEAAEVPLGLDVLANGEVPGALLEEWVHHFLHLWLLHGQRGRGHLLPLLVLKQMDKSVQNLQFPKCEKLDVSG